MKISRACADDSNDISITLEFMSFKIFINPNTDGGSSLTLIYLIFSECKSAGLELIIPMMYQVSVVWQSDYSVSSRVKRQIE